MKIMKAMDVYDRAMSSFRSWYPDLEDEPGACLYVMQCTMKACFEMGIEHDAEAGSAYWRMNHRPEPHNDTFSYTWEPNHPDSIQSVARGGLPEIHCWVRIHQTGFIFDCSTGRIREHALSMGHAWEAQPLPPFIYGPELSHYYAYERNQEATKFAIQTLMRGVLGYTDVPKLSAWASQ